MAMSDCIKCWETPCTCGYKYESWDTERLNNFIATLQAIVDSRHKAIEHKVEVDMKHHTFGYDPPLHKCMFCNGYCNWAGTCQGPKK